MHAVTEECVTVVARHHLSPPGPGGPRTYVQSFDLIRANAPARPKIKSGDFTSVLKDLMHNPGQACHE